jgi:hypothetical protein
MRERKDVYNLPSGDDTLDWYDKAVGRMKSLPITDSLSWGYQGAVHGTVTTLTPSITGFWAECQHGSAFFLPWHRMYVLHFERIVARHIEDLGGPADWALPYWNYTTSDPRTLSLPPQFCNPTRPDGTPNISTSPTAILRQIPAHQYWGAAMWRSIACEHPARPLLRAFSVIHLSTTLAAAVTAGRWN